MSEKTVLVVPKHLPKSGVRDEKFFSFLFFEGGCWDVQGGHRGQKNCSKPLITNIANLFCFIVKSEINL